MPTSELSIFNFPLEAQTPLPLPCDKLSKSPGVPLLHAAYERRVAEFPDRTAVDYLSPNQTGKSIYSRISLTYRQFDERVLDLALALENAIQTLNWPAVRGNQRIIPIFMSSCPEQYISILAILRAGHTFCPFPVDAPQERIKELLEDIGSPIVLGAGSKRFSTSGSTIESGKQDKLESVVWFDVTNVKQWVAKNFGSASNGTTQRHKLTGDDLAYVFYTSGSTGRPKGVQISHLAATCSISSHVAMIPGFSEEPVIRWFQLTAPTFDPFILEVFITLSLGGAICAAEREITLTDAEGAINELQANATHTVASLAMMLRPDRIPSLKILVCGGEKLNRKVIENFSFDSHHISSRANAGRAPQGLTNLYGPTECTINVSFERFTTTTRGTIIGDIMPTCSIILLDLHTLQPVPVGFPGHLAVGGPQVSPGYLHRPEENARQFVSSSEFGRLYLTGDKARIVWNEKGEQRLEYLGRIQDTQVKLNGRRLELEEVDSVIAKTKFVSDVATVNIEAQGVTQLVACITLDSGSSDRDAEKACRETAEKFLPQWMNPQHYIFLPRLPRASSGKVLRNSLRETAKKWSIHQANSGSIETSRAPKENPVSSASQKISSPHTDAELPKVLCQLLKRVLASNSQDVTPTTSLHALGFDSLRAIIFLQQSRDRGIGELGIQDMLKGLTPQELANIIVNRRQVKKEAEGAISGDEGSQAVNGANESSEVSPNLNLQTMLSDFDKRTRSRCAEQLGISSANIECVYPATNMQTRMVINFLDSGDYSDPYVKRSWIEHYVYNVPESIDSHRFQEALSTVIKRHDCFRTVFTIVEDPVAPCAQCVLSSSCSEATISWSNIYCDSSANTGKNSLFERIVENAQRTADEQMRLDRPPIAVSVIRSRSSNQCVFVLSLFHGIYDAVSLSLLRKEAMAEYHGKSQPTMTSFKHAVEMHFTPDPKTTFKFWYSRLAAARPYKLTGIPKSQSHVITSGHSKTAVPISPVSVTSLESKIRWAELKEGAMHNLLTTPLSVCEAAWALVLLECQQKTDESRSEDERTSFDVMFSSTLHSRYDSESQNCMGLTLTTIPMRVAGDTASDDAETNQKMCQIFALQHAEALEHLQFPCPSLAFARTLDRFDTNLVLQSFGEEDKEDFPGYQNGVNVRKPYRGSDFSVPVMMEIFPSHGRSRTMVLQCTFQNSSPQYPWLTDESAKVLLEMFETNLRWILANPEEIYGAEKS